MASNNLKRKKINNESNAPMFNINIELKPNQKKEILNFFKSNSISCLTGDPGTGKTFTSVHYALSLLKDGAYDQIIITKPLVEMGRSMGYLPGAEKEKVDAYLDSYSGIFEDIVGKDAFRALVNGKKIIFEPMNFCRGTSYKYSMVLLDEAQNATLHELVTFTTRVSDTSKLIILGDNWQSDIKNSGFSKYVELFCKVDGIGYKHLDESFQLRNSMITDMYKIYKQFLDSLK